MRELRAGCHEGDAPGRSPEGELHEERLAGLGLDVERLPPEAIEVTRDLYSHGISIEAFVGARGFIGGVGDLSRPGPYLHLGVGWEALSWLWIAVSAEGSMHRTDAPSPPSPTVFELVSFMAELRLQANVSARAALWLLSDEASYSTGAILNVSGGR